MSSSKIYIKNLPKFLRIYDGYKFCEIYKEVESLYCFFVFGWIKLKFGVRGNFRLPISNLNSKTQYHFKILRQFHSSSLDNDFSPALPHELVNE